MRFSGSRWGVHRKQAAARVEQGQQVGQGRNFIGLVRGLVLPQAQPRFVAPGVKQLPARRPALRVRRAEAPPIGAGACYPRKSAPRWVRRCGAAPS